MAQQIINLGATGSGAGGDSARTAFEKAIANFAELYIAALPGTAAQKQAARDMFGLGTAATRAVQTGPTDTTAGAVATTEGARFAALANYGAYYSGSTGKNIDTLVGGESGLFSTSNPGTFPPGFGAFVYIETQQTYSGSSVVQEACDYGSSSVPLGRRAFRVRSNGGEWGAWQVYYHAANILGTVSQSGGVPTGAIIERGSNANGEYVRFADGTQICTGRIAIDLSNASAQNINWPATFTSAVPFSLAIDSSPGLPSSTIYDAFQSIAPMTDSSIRGRVVVRTTAPYTIQCLFVAIGRWF